MERKPARPASVILVVIVVLLVVYPFSVGPASYVASVAVDRDIILIDALVNTIYRPIFSLPEPIATKIGDWCAFWSQLAEPPRRADTTRRRI